MKTSERTIAAARDDFWGGYGIPGVCKLEEGGIGGAKSADENGLNQINPPLSTQVQKKKHNAKNVRV